MTCPFNCKQNNLSSLLGEPKQGFHEARIGNYALNDILGTMALAAASSYATNTPYWQNLLGWFVVAEASHVAFGVKTQFIQDMGIEIY
jgi:hypothetical protein